MRGRLALLGPAFVAAVAYIDPGNFATNITAGAKYGYLLVWVIVAANLIAMLVQYLSAKIGIASERNLPELCRDSMPKPVTFGLWLQAEAIAIATDLAEFVGAAIALYLLFGVPLFTAGLMTALVAFAILALQTRGYRRFELAIAAMLGLVLLGFLYDFLKVGVDLGGFGAGLVPSFSGTERPARRRHPRRLGDAARRLPALRAHPGPDPRARRGREAGAAAVRPHRRDDRDGAGRGHQPDHARGRGRPILRQRTDRGRLDRGRTPASRPCSGAARRWPLPSPCSPRGSRARASAPTRVRS